MLLGEQCQHDKSSKFKSLIHFCLMNGSSEASSSFKLLIPVGHMMHVSGQVSAKAKEVVGFEFSLVSFYQENKNQKPLAADKLLKLLKNIRHSGQSDLRPAGPPVGATGTMCTVDTLTPV